ncbi:MAG TPA: hypothetical protein VFD27_02325, partial [Chthoniobacteraceae bacterium]|nr:hypothetical protein [Chthoniobacteraceae bacterium]
MIAIVVTKGALFAADVPWAVADAPFRAVVKAKVAPENLETGYLIALPELGQTMSGAADVVLLDARGTYLPLAKVWRGEGQTVLLLAQSLPAGQEFFVYFGGNHARRQTPWNPKVSLLMETRRMPSGTKLDSWPDLEAAWKKAGEVDGADFVPAMAHGANPFGESVNFLTHYTGWLKTDDKKLSLYTVSSDASFVLVGDKYEFGWPGEHGPQVNAKTVSRKEVNTSPGATRIDYYHAAKGAHAPTMVLGRSVGGKDETIPASAWLHPGSMEIVRLE